MLVIDDSDNYSLFDENERQELIFKIFTILALGGELCQPEEKLDALLEVTKAIYKEIVSVAKDVNTNQIQIVSDAFQLEISVSGFYEVFCY